MKVWINGQITGPDEAKVSVLDHGLLYGDGVFEGIRCSHSRVVDLDAHLERLAISARAVYLGAPTTEVLRGIVLETAAALGEPECYVRLVVTRGVGALGIDTSSCEVPTVFCIAGKLRLYAPKPEGLALATSSLRRPAADVLDPRVKSLNYLNNVMAKHEAKRHGADEALVLNSRGTIAEASGANVFAVLGGELCTPPSSDGALGGITRRRVLGLARQLGFVTHEQSLTRYDLLGADEVFLTGTGAGIVSVGSLDGNPIGASHNVATALTGATVQYILQHGIPFASH